MRAKFQMYRLLIRGSDWLNFIQFSGYKTKRRLVSIIGKRDDQSLISISTILKFSAQMQQRWRFYTIFLYMRVYFFLCFILLDRINTVIWITKYKETNVIKYKILCKFSNRLNRSLSSLLLILRAYSFWIKSFSNCFFLF